MLGPPDLVPLTGPLAAVETIYRVPTGRIAYAHARIIHVMSGRTHIETAHGAHIALAGDTLVIGSGAWCAIQPNPWVRSWTIYVDEALLREHMRWAVPEDAPLTQGVPPSSWDGAPICLRLPPSVLLRLEPILRRMSVTNAAESHLAGARIMALFADAVVVVIPELLADIEPHRDPRRVDRVRRASPPLVRSEVRKAVSMFEEQLAHPWRVAEVASEVALSRSQLDRLFRRHLGLPPIRMLIELRLTEFTRLIEETGLTITEAARSVGWNDPRVATIRFQRRYGIPPSRYRKGN
ncbi:helix-turn-helix domain-containing protein [Microbacterium aurum]